VNYEFWLHTNGFQNQKALGILHARSICPPYYPWLAGSTLNGSDRSFQRDLSSNFSGCEVFVLEFVGATHIDSIFKLISL